MRARLTALLLLPLALALSACGFRPLYAPEIGANGQATPAIGPIVVNQVAGKSGHVLKTELDLLFSAERGTGPVRRLSVVLVERVAGLGFRVDESASRSDLQLTATYDLFDVNGRRVLRGRVYSLASYDVPASAYGEISAQNDARERAAADLAQRIRTDLALKLAQARERAAARTRT